MVSLIFYLIFKWTKIVRGAIMNVSYSLNDVFDKILHSNNIFKNRDVLRHDYIPDTLPHRETQINRLGEILAPILRGDRPSNIFIYGKTGTGKTAAVKYVLNTLLKKASSLSLPLNFCYVNCRITSSAYRVYSDICHSIGVKVPFTGLSVSELFRRLVKGLNSRGLFLISVLDEIDELVKTKGDSILYELTRINESLIEGKVSVIGISNDLKFKELLDPRVLSSLSEEEIVFSPYNAKELKDILQQRSTLAFYEDAINDGALSLCAALAAAEHGDARRALDLLRVAGELAERGGSNFVSENHIRKAERRMEHDRVVEVLKNLPLHSKLILCSMYLLNRANIHYAITGDIYQIYSELCELSGFSTLTQRRVSGLINELDTVGLMNTRVVSLGRYGRTKKIFLAVDRNPIKEVFLEDPRFSKLIEYKPKCLSKKPGKHMLKRIKK